MNPNFFQKIMLVIIGSLARIMSAPVRTKLESFTNAQGKVQAAALEFDLAVGEDGAAATVAEGLLKLADKFVKGDVSEEDKAEIKSIAAQIVSLPDANAEQKLEALFDALVEAKDAGAELVAVQNAPPAEEV